MIAIVPQKILDLLAERKADRADAADRAAPKYHGRAKRAGLPGKQRVWPARIRRRLSPTARARARDGELPTAPPIEKMSKKLRALV